MWFIIDAEDNSEVFLRFWRFSDGVVKMKRECEDSGKLSSISLCFSCTRRTFSHSSGGLRSELWGSSMAPRLGRSWIYVWMLCSLPLLQMCTLSSGISCKEYVLVSWVQGGWLTERWPYGSSCCLESSLTREMWLLFSFHSRYANKKTTTCRERPWWWRPAPWHNTHTHITHTSATAGVVKYY